MTIPEEEKRMADSRERLDKMMQRAIGIYMAKEAKIKDQWRDQSEWQVIKHLKHEIEEIERSATPNRRIHNLLDACGLCAILASKIELGTNGEITDGEISDKRRVEKYLNKLKDYGVKRVSIITLVAKLEGLSVERIRKVMDELPGIVEVEE